MATQKGRVKEMVNVQGEGPTLPPPPSGGGGVAGGAYNRDGVGQPEKGGGAPHQQQSLTEQLVTTLTPILERLVEQSIEQRWEKFVATVNEQLEGVYGTVNETQTTVAAIQRFVLENQVDTARTKAFGERYTRFLLGEALAMGADPKMVAKMAAEIGRVEDDVEEEDEDGVDERKGEGGGR